MADRLTPREPLPDECNNKALVYESDAHRGYAMWYPQMGGYVGKAVAMFDKTWSDDKFGATGGCIDVYVWHDGEFPFTESDGQPRHLHHCDPTQFISFGETLAALNEQGRVTVSFE